MVTISEELTVEKFSLLGIDITSSTMKDAVNILDQNIADNKQCHVITANPEIVMMACKDDDFKDILQSAEFVFADGTGVVWAGRRKGFSVPERVTGFDLTQQLLKLADQKNYSVFFFGAADGVAQKALDNIAEKHQNINFSGCRHGFFCDADNDEIIDQINAAAPDILLVALGAPKQEKWVHENRKSLQAKVILCIGGSFDVMAGNISRAPAFIQKLGLEWLYRALKQPSRIGRLAAIPHFVLKVLFDKHK